jgi:ankyrin repeat protein
MSNYNFDTVRRIYDWERAFLSGDRSTDQWAIDVLSSGTDEDGVPLIIHAPKSLRALEFLNRNGVDLLRPEPDGQTLLWDNRLDLDAHSWLADLFLLHHAVDLPDSEGMTALSALIKQGELSRARILLERGASPNSFATIARYGGSRLSIAIQAVYASGTPLSLSQEDAAIAALSLLKEFGLSVSSDEKVGLTHICDAKTRLKSWIEANL